MKKAIDLIRQVDGIRLKQNLSHSTLAGKAGTQSKQLEAALDIGDVRLECLLKLAHALGYELVLEPMGDDARDEPVVVPDPVKTDDTGDWIEFDDLALFVRNYAKNKHRNARRLALDAGIDVLTAQRVFSGKGVSLRTMHLVSNGLGLRFQVRAEKR